MCYFCKAATRPDQSCTIHEDLFLMRMMSKIMPRILRRIKIKWMSCILARPTEAARPDQSVS